MVRRLVIMLAMAYHGKDLGASDCCDANNAPITKVSKCRRYGTIFSREHIGEARITHMTSIPNSSTSMAITTLKLLPERDL